MAKNKTPLKVVPPPSEHPLSEEEYKNFLTIQATRAQLSSELEKLDLVQENTFLKASVRLGVDLKEWGVDLKRKVYVPRPPAQK